jgi:putative oxidoreductase
MQSNAFLERHAAYAATLLRIALGLVFIAHAYAKAAIFSFAGTEQFFAAHGFWPWLTYPVFAIELFAGLALVLGVGSRIASLSLLPVAIGALGPHLQNGWMFSNSGGGWEYVAFLIVALAAQTLLGDGALSAARFRTLGMVRDAGLLSPK